ncbi:hypothetical protein JCM18918_3850 [Cutibacterium acnes JCM 18918]|nr:hypothetical protein JCM18918_3850 [Cutibacterium acnes JCM 18918]
MVFSSRATAAPKTATGWWVCGSGTMWSAIMPSPRPAARQSRPTATWRRGVIDMPHTLSRSSYRAAPVAFLR